MAAGCVALVWLVVSAPLAAREDAPKSSAGAESPGVVPLEAPATAFAGEELALRFACGKEIHVAWQASAARRPLAGGVVAARDGRCEIRFRTPEVREGVVLPIEVAVNGAVLKILVFGKNPLEGRAQWAGELRIVLFDPAQKTAEAFEEIGLRYRQATGLGALAAVTEGIVVVGEGLALGDHRGLSGVLCGLARKGLPVIVLMPASGQLEICDPAPRRFELQGDRAGQTIDPRTAADLTRPGGYRISGDENGPVLRITDQASDYAWGDFRYDDARGRLCCLSWSLLARWQTSPAPWFFLVRVLEIVSSGQDLLEPAPSAGR